MSDERRVARVRLGAALAMLGLFGQVALTSLAGLAALAPAEPAGAAAWPSVFEICTAYGLKRIALPGEPANDQGKAPAPFSGTAACHAFCTSHGPAVPASVAVPSPAFVASAGARPGDMCDPAPVSHGHKPFLARPPPLA